MIKGDYDKLQDLAKNNVCAEHKTPLVVAWYGAEKCWTLRCAEGTSYFPNHLLPDASPRELTEVPGHYPDTLTRQLSLTQEYKAGTELPSFIEANIINERRKRAMSQDKELIPRHFEGVPNKDLATGELLVPEQVTALMNYA
ncbi:unnamed protein product, partial [marine sediment metagenome]